MHRFLLSISLIGNRLKKVLSVSAEAESPGATLIKHGYISLFNTELNDLRKIICLRKTKVSVERILVYKVIENLVEFCLPCFTIFSMKLYCLPCIYTNDIIDLLP